MKTVSVGYYYYILEILEGLGLSKTQTKKLTPAHLKHEPNLSVRISLEEFKALLDLAESSLNDPHIGMHISQNFRISSFGNAGSIYSICENIEQSIAMTMKYACLAHTLGQFEKVDDKHPNSPLRKYVWVPSFESHLNENYKQITECIIGNYIATINWLSWGLGKSIEKVQFQHSAIEPISEYQNVLNCKIEFDAEETAIILHKDIITMPLPTSNPVKLSLLEKKLKHVLAQYNMKNPLTERVRYTLHKIISHRRPSLELVAQELALSERTLKRYLTQEGTSFRDLIKSVKIELFESYLKEGIPFSEIAQLLWYADQSALTRAYKKWHGYSPTRKIEKTAAEQ